MAVSSKKYIKNCTGEDSLSKNKKENLISRIIFYFLLVSFFSVAIYIYFFSGFLQISNISILGTEELKTQDIQLVIDKSLEGKFLNLIPKNNYLLVSKEEISDLLVEDFKKIRSVEIEKKFPNNLIVKVDERKALLIWCVNDSNCFLIDENGTAYSQADFGSAELTQNHLLKINDQSQAQVVLGDNIINPEFEQYLLSIKDAFGKLGLTVLDEFDTPSRMSEEIYVKTDQGARVILSTQFSLESSIRTLTVVLKKEIKKEQLSNVEYLDLRIENEAFYKLIGSLQTNSETTGVEAAASNVNEKENKKK